MAVFFTILNYLPRAGTWASLGTTPRGKAFLEVPVSPRPGPEANTRPTLPPVKLASQDGDVLN